MKTLIVGLLAALQIVTATEEVNPKERGLSEIPDIPTIPWKFDNYQPLKIAYPAHLRPVEKVAEKPKSKRVSKNQNRKKKV